MDEFLRHECQVLRLRGASVFLFALRLQSTRVRPECSSIDPRSLPGRKGGWNMNRIPWAGWAAAIPVVVGDWLSRD